jgi:hypothetical protein
MSLCLPILLTALGQPVLAQSPVATALSATVTIEVDGPGGRAHGSGFVTSSDGTIVTAAHVIEGATSAIVRFQNGDELDVEGVTEVDWIKDFAIIRVAGFDLPTIDLGNADDLAVGQRVIVIGAPIDPTLAGTVSDGLVAAIRMNEGTRHIQISAPTSPGNSGGPVMTEDGHVIGLVVSGIAAEGAENLNFALPINYVRGQLPLAASRPLQALADVQVVTMAGGGGGGSSSGSGASTTPSIGVATYGDVNLDERFLPDPHEVSLIAGGDVDVDVGSCSYGYVADSPDVNFYYTSSGSSNLYVYVEGAEDTTLLINQPDGSWVCDDDDLGDSNPVVVVPAAASGLYNIWVGTYGDTNSNATLYISELDPR